MCHSLLLFAYFTIHSWLGFLPSIDKVLFCHPAPNNLWLHGRVLESSTSLTASFSKQLRVNYRNFLSTVSWSKLIPRHKCFSKYKLIWSCYAKFPPYISSSKCKPLEKGVWKLQTPDGLSFWILRTETPLCIRSHNRDGGRKSWDPRGPMIWDNFSIFRTNTPSWRHVSALLHARVVGSRVYVVTLHDQTVRVERFSSGFFTAMAWNKAGKSQGSSMHTYALSW